MYSPDDILRLIRTHVHHPATARELTQLLRVPREERVSFKRQLKVLVADGALLQIRGNRFGIPEKMDLVVGRLTTNPGGFGFVVPEGQEGAPRAERQDVFIAAANLTEAMHGDRVVARV
ncbi:MAG: ribonuclease R, partial [Vicinamibacterales bacterium]